MKRYAVFTSNGKEMLGSDAWLPLDNRLGFHRAWRKAYSQLQSLKAIHPSWDGFTFYAGSCIRDAKPMPFNR